MRIAMDAFGGDNAPLAVLQGAEMAKKEYGANIVLVGDTELIKKCAAENGVDLSGIDIEHAEGVMEMHDEAKLVLKQKRGSSMGRCLDMVANGEADVLISAGPTGALLTGATMIVKRIKGVKRPALASEVPGLTSNYLIVDCGANAECRPEMLCQFGVMGSIYAKHAMGVENPRVAVANIGAEDSKGTDLQREAYAMLKAREDINFIGNVEGRGLPMSECDVAVCDGFTGNMVLKTIEGVGMAYTKILKGMFMKNLGTKLAALMLGGGIADLKKKMDYAEIGGAPFIGLKKPVIKAHGSCNAKGFKSAVGQAIRWVNSDVTAAITEAFAKAEPEE